MLKFHYRVGTRPFFFPMVRRSTFLPTSFERTALMETGKFGSENEVFVSSQAESSQLKTLIHPGTEFASWNQTEDASNHSGAPIALHKPQEQKKRKRGKGHSTFSTP